MDYENQTRERPSCCAKCLHHARCVKKNCSVKIAEEKRLKNDELINKALEASGLSPKCAR